MQMTLTRPCADCPFRTDRPGFLRPGRAYEIAHALVAQQGTFTCHKTNTFEENAETEEIETVETNESQHCAGALIMLEHMKEPNQMMRWMDRIGLYNASKLDMTAPVFKDANEFAEHHAQQRPGRKP